MTSDRPATERERAEIARKLRGLIHTTRPVLTAAERAVLIQAEQLLSSLPPVRADGETKYPTACSRYERCDCGSTILGEHCEICLWPESDHIPAPVRAEEPTDHEEWATFLAAWVDYNCGSDKSELAWREYQDHLHRKPPVRGCRCKVCAAALPKG